MKQPDSSLIERAASELHAGNLVVFPTETVYGLGADARSSEAVARIFAAKGRPADNPLIVHLLGMEWIERVAESVSRAACELLSRFSPGPLTVVLPAGPEVAPAVTAGLGTVAVRIPAHPVARSLLRACDLPIAAPSANRSGEPSPTTVEMSRRSLGERVALYLDGGRCSVGLESTVLSVEESTVRILRPGAVTAADVRAVLPRAEIVDARGHSIEAASPGTRHRHYQPRAAVRLFSAEAISSLGSPTRLSGTIGLICQRSVIDRAADALGGDAHRIVWRSYESPSEYATHLYRWFTELDDQRCEVILAQYPEREGVGEAIRDRLRRAAGEAGEPELG